MIQRLPPVLLLMAVILPSEAKSQALWPDSLRGKAEFGVEWTRPTFEQNDDYYKGSRGVWLVSGRVLFNEKYEVVIAVPTFVGNSGGGGSTGSPYIGLHILDDHRRVEFALGFRPNFASQTTYGGPSVGYIGDYDHFEAAIDDAAALTATVLHEVYRNEDGTNVRFRFGGMMLHAVGLGIFGPNDYYFDYGIRVGRDTPNLRVGVSATGRWLLDSEGESLAESTTNQAAMEASFLSGAIRPYVGARLPLDEPLSSTLRYALIVGVTGTIR
jgi:hypothetical protein